MIAVNQSYIQVGDEFEHRYTVEQGGLPSVAFTMYDTMCDTELCSSMIKTGR